MKLDSFESLAGSIERITYYNPENGYSVIRLRPDARKTPGKDHQGLVTVTGNLPELAVGEQIKLLGRWVEHPKHGLQFQAEKCDQTLPATTAGIRRYLGSGLIKGIGPRLAERIVELFGMDTLEVIENNPERLLEIDGIGETKAAMICNVWRDHHAIRGLMQFLQEMGVQTSWGAKIYKAYGPDAVDFLRSEPYHLAKSDCMAREWFRQDVRLA